MPSQTVTIPKDVISQIRILTHPADSTNYKGSATVGAVVGETITLNLGTGGTLTILARAGGKSLPVAMKDVVDVFYQERVDPDVPDDVIAIRTKSGAAIANVIRVGSAPLKLAVPLFDVSLVQQDKPGIAEPPVLITAPSFKDAATFSTGEMKSVGDAMALVVGSTSSPFMVNVLVWRNP